MDPTTLSSTILPVTRTTASKHWQRTISQPVLCAGRGLHSGRRVTARIIPAAPDSGIVFRRFNRRGLVAEIPALWQQAEPMILSSGLRHHTGLRIRTIEHVLAALYACRIDNAVVEVSAEELPIMDGSALTFVVAIEAVGAEIQKSPRRCIRIVSPISYEYDNRRIAAEPCNSFEVEVSLSLPETGQMIWRGMADPETFRREIVPARTFARLKRALQGLLIGHLTPMAICRGASLRNALVLTRRGTLNKGGMRMPAEPARHRVLDLVGDLMLAGAPIIGRITGHRPSHATNQGFLRHLFASPDAWQWSYFDEEHED
jgi:UDP-3-O-[3-hydroxymyristoyl] N-acetylglucosamine deacetylase